MPVIRRKQRAEPAQSGRMTQLVSTLVCPECGEASTETMPTAACRARRFSRRGREARQAAAAVEPLGQAGGEGNGGLRSAECAAHGIDDRVDEMLVDRTCGDEQAEIDRPGGEREQRLAIGIRR